MRLSKKKKRLLIKTLFVLLLALLGYLMYLFFTYKGFYVTTITVNNTTYTQAIQESINNDFLTKTAYIFPSQHTVFLPLSRIKKEVLLAYPEIQDVTFSRKGLQELDVALVLRTPLYRMDNDLAIDTNAVVYKEPKDTSALPLFAATTHFPTRDELENITTLANKISLRLLPVTKININEDRDVGYFFGSSTGYVIAPLSADPQALWSTFLSALDTEPLSTLLQTKLHDVEYIDLRFGNKVFYKFGNGEKTIATSTESVATTTQTSSTSTQH